MSGERSEPIFAILKLGNQAQRVKISPQYFFWVKTTLGEFYACSKIVENGKILQNRFKENILKESL